MTFPISSESGETAHTANLALSGKLNSIGSVTLTNDNVATSQTVVNYFAGPNSVILFDPLNSPAALELASGAMFVSSAATDRLDGSFIITYAAATTSPAREFRYIILG